MKYGFLTIIGEPYLKFRTEKSSKRTSFVKCVCDCGVEIDLALTDIKCGNVKSCGCYQKAQARKAKVKHDMSMYGRRNPIYGLWLSMKNRCYNPDQMRPDYKNYFLRGIVVCEEWKYDFMAFYRWALSNGYAKGMTIDRRNNDENYSPDNCRFITRAENNQNRRSTVLTPLRAKHIRILNKYSKKTAKELSFLYGVGVGNIHNILQNKVWKEQQA